jgi:hypothetical protein
VVGNTSYETNEEIWSARAWKARRRLAAKTDASGARIARLAMISCKILEFSKY